MRLKFSRALVMQTIKTLSGLALCLGIVACASKPVARPEPVVVTPPEPVVTQKAKQQYNQGLQWMKQGELDKAAKIFEELTRQNAKLSGPWVNLGIISEKKGEVEAAFKNYQRALGINPDNVTALNQMALIRQQQGKFQEALQYYKRGLNSQPDNLDLNYNIAILYELYLQNYRQAVQHYQRYLDKLPHAEKKIQNRIKIIRREHKL